MCIRDRFFHNAKRAFFSSFATVFCPPLRAAFHTSRRTSSSALVAQWGRPGARCQPLGWSVSPVPPPEPACQFPGTGLSTRSRQARGSRVHRLGPRCRDGCSPVAVANDPHRARVEECDPVLLRPPTLTGVAAAQRLPARLAVFSPQPQHHLSLIHISEPTRLLSISYAV